MEFFATIDEWVPLSVVGVTGFVLYVGNYLGLSLRLISGDSIVYFVINTVAASLVLIGLMRDFNMASVLIQSFWIVIGVSAIALRCLEHLRGRRMRHQ